MFQKIRSWFGSGKVRVETQKPVPAAAKAPGVDLVIPVAQGFELEGLGFLGSGKTKAVPLDKESFRD